MKLDVANPTKLEAFQGMKIRDVACGENHTIATMNSGERNKKMVWGWGMYKHGQLGIGEVT